MIATGFFFEVDKVDSKHISNAKIESRMESVTVYASLSVITVFVSKYVATVVPQSLKEMDGDTACSRI